MRVAIAGYGVEGKANYTYWRQKGDEVVVVDERQLSPYDMPYSAEALLGKNVFKKLDGFDMVVRTAGLNPRKIKTTGRLWSATNEFFAECPAPIIGVTGTKGKGTTCSMIASILRAAGKTVHLVGNISTPALEVLPTIEKDDIVVYELSSFQLWDLQLSPHIAVVLLIEPDHMDVHKDMKEYVAAKSNIRLHQQDGDACFYHPTNPYSRDIAYATDAGQAKRYASEDDGTVYVQNDGFYVGDELVCKTNTVKLPGKHNVENACAALSVAKAVGIENEACEKGLSSFEGLPHRLKFVREVKGIGYYDDSIATTPGSAIAAIRAFEQPKVLILGGSEKGAHYDEVVAECKTANVNVVAIGQTGKKIAKLCKKQGVQVKELGASSMDEIVKAATELSSKGGVVIMSPASASFDMFKNYADRGEHFTGAVERL